MTVRAVCPCHGEAWYVRPNGRMECAVRKREQVHQWQAANRERKCETDRRWRAAHREQERERVREWARAWRLANPEEHCARSRQWRKDNPEKVRESARRFRAANPENPEIGRERASRRRARVRGNGVVSYKRVDIYKRDGGICHICRRRVARQAFTIDHLIPIFHGGPDSPENVAVAHLRCNLRRGTGRIPAQLRLVG